MNWPPTTSWRSSPSQPGIGKTPFFDRRLSEPTEQLAGLVASRLKVDLPRQYQLSWPEYRSTRKHEIAVESDVTTVTSSEVPAPFQMERQAHKTLLSRLVGNTIPAEEGTSPVSDFVSVHQKTQISRPQHRPIMEISQSEAGTSPTIFRDMGSHRHWLLDLAQRAESSLCQLDLDALAVPSYASPAWSLTAEKRSLDEQWALPLDGQTASADLLVFLASLSERHQTEFDQEHQLNSPPGAPTVTLKNSERSSAKTSGDRQIGAPLHAQTGSLMQSQFRLELEDGMKVRTLSPERGPERSSGTWFDPAISIGQVSWKLKRSGSQGEVNGKNLGVGLEPESSDRTAPPSVASSLPLLLRSQNLELPTPLSVAAATSRQGAQQEAATELGEDLGALAAKIKRILDEEARRYGIDV